MQSIPVSRVIASREYLSTDGYANDDLSPSGIVYEALSMKNTTIIQTNRERH